MRTETVHETVTAAKRDIRPCTQSLGGVDHGGSGRGSDPLKLCRRSQSMFWRPPAPPPKKISHSFIQKLLLDNSASFISSRMKDLCQKWKLKLISLGACNRLMARPDWPWPPCYFTTDLRHCTLLYKHRDRDWECVFICQLTYDVHQPRYKMKQNSEVGTEISNA